MSPIGQFPSNELSTTAGSLVDAAVAVTTGLMQYGSSAETLTALRKGRPHDVQAFRHDLARQVGTALLLLDDYVFAVYEERLPGDDDLSRMFRIWVVARYRTSKLYATIDRLNDALIDGIEGITGDRPVTLIQSFIVDERDSHLLRGREFWSGNEPVLLASRETTRS